MTSAAAVFSLNESRAITLRGCLKLTCVDTFRQPVRD
jgi:hypothetical protein